MDLFGRARIAELEAEVARKTARILELSGKVEAERNAWASVSTAYADEISRSNRLSGRLMVAHKALREIKGMVTPHAAYAARKMAARADQALPADLGGHPKDGGSGFTQPKPNGAAVQGVVS